MANYKNRYKYKTHQASVTWDAVIAEDILGLPDNLLDQELIDHIAARLHFDSAPRIIADIEIIGQA